MRSDGVEGDIITTPRLQRGVLSLLVMKCRIDYD